LQEITDISAGGAGTVVQVVRPLLAESGRLETFVVASGIDWRFAACAMLLTSVSLEDISVLMTWFGDETSTQEWGGWEFRYPFDDSTFRVDAQIDELDSFVSRGEAGELIAFGQVKEKYGRGHVARLVLAPEYRGRGLGTDLVSSLCDKATELFDCAEHSLFVSRANTAALRCYVGLGFIEAPYPEDDGTEDKTLYMVRRASASG